jgi:hypothetical protein
MIGCTFSPFVALVKAISKTATTGTSKATVHCNPGTPDKKQMRDPSCIGCRYRESGVAVQRDWRDEVRDDEEYVV